MNRRRQHRRPAAIALQLCPLCLGRDVAGELDGLPLCASCADLVVERAQAVALAPQLRYLLPPLVETARQDWPA